jgi:D-alanyl-lipoteichoic acid acyltransferase DltB (MBOAT superfamily)
MIAYQAVPARRRWMVLLAASYLFFWSVSRKLLVFLWLTTAISYGAGRCLKTLKRQRKDALAQADRAERKTIRIRYQKKQQRVVFAALFLQVGTLVILKYSAFLTQNLNRLLESLSGGASLPVPAFVLPIGISFYTLEAVAYLVDVYRETIEPEDNPARMALFFAFFPKLMEGPLCRYGQVAGELWQGHPITYHNLTYGIQRILFGMLKKLVIADRLNILIKTVFQNPADYDGGIIAVAMFFYTCQLYMEFSGTMDVVIGTAEIFDITLPENFKRPFLSRSVSKFWTRWHITLGAWMKDYIFYPISMSKPMNRLTIKARKRLGNHYGPMAAASVALFVVWICNGLWHGAAWSYLFFGMYHFFWIFLENITGPVIHSWTHDHGIREEGKVYVTVQILLTTLIVNVGELFFRAESLTMGFFMFGRMLSSFTLASFFNGAILTLGMDARDFLISLLAILLVLGVHGLEERGISVRDKLSTYPVALRWGVYYGLILMILVFGAYGMGYVPVDPIYANF